jgi:hypothetical protein
MNRFGPSTALALLAVTLTLLHGVTSWIPVLRWIPIWTSLTLLGSVNVAPRVIQTITTLGAGFSAIIEIGIRSRTGLVQEMDLEETVVLLQEMAEGPNTGYQGPDAFEFLLGHMNHPPEAVDPELGEENPDSLQLDSGSVSTRSDVRQILQNLNQMPNQVSQDTAFASLGTVPEQNGTFPQAPQDQLFEMPLIRSVPSSRTEESLVHMLPG